jgi:hypothetical protein
MKVEGIPAKLEVTHNHNVQTHNAVDIQMSRETAANIVYVVKATGAVVMTVVVAKAMFKTSDLIVGRLLYWK